MIYGTVDNGNTSATAGVQRDDACFNQYFCNGSGGQPTGGLGFGSRQARLARRLLPTPSEAIANRYLHTNAYTNSNRYGYTYSYSHTYTNANSSHSHSYSRQQQQLTRQRHGYSYSDSYSYSNGYSDAPATSNVDGNFHVYSKTHPESKRYPATKASTHSSASAVMGDGELVERVVLNALFGDKSLPTKHTKTTKAL